MLSKIRVLQPQPYPFTGRREIHHREACPFVSWFSQDKGDLVQACGGTRALEVMQGWPRARAWKSDTNLFHTDPGWGVTGTRGMLADSLKLRRCRSSINTVLSPSSLPGLCLMGVTERGDNRVVTGELCAVWPICYFISAFF